MSIGSKLYELRSEKDLSQKDLAQAIGVSQSTIAKIEVGRNEATASTIRKLAKFFNISTDYLLELEDDFCVKPLESKSALMSEEERKLLKDYRSLNFACKKLVKQTIETLKNSTASSDSGKAEDIS